MSQTFKVLFFLKKGKGNNDKRLPIYVRVTVDGLRVEWSLQRAWEAGSKWNKTLGWARGGSEDAKTLNAYLDTLQGAIFDVQRNFALRDESITAEKVRSKILRRSDEKRYSLLEVYKYHNSQF